MNREASWKLSIDPIAIFLFLAVLSSLVALYFSHGETMAKIHTARCIELDGGLQP